MWILCFGDSGKSLIFLFWKQFIWSKLNCKQFLLGGNSNLNSILLYVVVTLNLLRVCIAQGPDKDLARVPSHNLKITPHWLSTSGLSPDFPAAEIALNSVLCSTVLEVYPPYLVAVLAFSQIKAVQGENLLCVILFFQVFTLLKKNPEWVIHSLWSAFVYFCILSRVNSCYIREVWVW